MSKYNNILLTRDQDGNALWREKLNSAGIHVTELPCICFNEFHFNESQVSQINKKLADSDYVVWTSVRGVHFSKKFFFGKDHDRKKLCAIGSSTADALRDEISEPYLISEEMNANDLAKKIIALEEIKDKKITLLLAKNASDDLQERLETKGAIIDRINIYETKPITKDAQLKISSLKIDGIIIASPSAIDGLLNQFEIDIEIDIFPIGPTTKSKLETLGFDCKNIPERPSIEGIIKEIQC
jgi:uroporphyrinogen-III synthase